jgi:hypothetical protein
MTETPWSTRGLQSVAPPEAAITPDVTTGGETPQTTRQWQDERFPDSAIPARILKTKEELLELERAILSGDRAAQLEECADVAITICGWLSVVDDVDWPLDHRYASGDRFLDIESAVRAEFPYLAFKNLFSFVDSKGLGDLVAAINAKMATNRARIWNIRPDGTGKHQRPQDPNAGSTQ